METVFIAGLAGAGKTTAAAVLEDIGYYRVDNIPLPLVETVLEELGRLEYERVCVVIGTLYAAQTDTLQQIIDNLSQKGISVRTLLLIADEDEILRRYSITRRTHPFQGELHDALARERHYIGGWLNVFDTTLDTTDMTIHQLKGQLIDLFDPAGAHKVLNITFVSFGFKYGIYRSADNVIDVRFLPNPYFVPELRPKTGLDNEIYRFVIMDTMTQDFIARWREMFDAMFNWYVQEGKAYATIAFGCTGGRHRSVSLARYFSHHYSGMEKYRVSVYHRDHQKENSV